MGDRKYAGVDLKTEGTSTNEVIGAICPAKIPCSRRSIVASLIVSL